MARRVFFSFHYQLDAWRVSQVRNCWVAQKGDTNQFMDAADWEKVRRKGRRAVIDWIDGQLNGTGVTIVLIGQKTSTRPFVLYEIEESYRRGNGIVGIYINRIKDAQGRICAKGYNPLNKLKVEVKRPWWDIFDATSTTKRVSDIYRTYDWVKQDGRAQIGNWIEEAAQITGR